MATPMFQTKIQKDAVVFEIYAYRKLTTIEIDREIAFYKSSAIAQGSNIVRRELGLPVTYVPAADPALQIDVVPGRDAASG